MGTDAKLIHGDRWQQIDGLQNETINLDLITLVKGNEDWTVKKNLTYDIHGTTEDTRWKDVKVLFKDESLFEYVLSHTDHHHEKDHFINPTHTFEIANIEGEIKTVDLALKASVIEGKVMVVDMTVAKLEGTGFTAEGKGATIAGGGFQYEHVVFDVQERELDAKLKGMETKISALDAQMGGPRTLIMPVRIGICIAVHIDSPWA